MRLPTATAVALALLGAGCASAPLRKVGTAAAGDPSWPREPGKAIAYAGEIRGPENLGIERGFFARLWRAIAGAAESEQLYRPFGVALAPDGRVAVSDPGRRAVHLIDPGRKQYRRITGAPGRALTYPVAAVFIGATLVVADSETARLLAFDEKGAEVALPVKAPPLGRPGGLAVDAGRGRLYVSDVLGHTVHALSLDGREPDRPIGGRGGEAGRFNFPTHLAVDREGNLLVCDAMNFRVQVFDPSLTPLRSFGQLGDQPGAFSKPKGVAVDEEGNVFVVEGLYDVVQIFDRKGRLLGVIGGSGTQAGRFWLPGGAAIRDGLLYVADTFNARVQVFELARRATP
ncbi:MAG: hypothetical protein HYZ28_12400 [Myxococcales bacterium]|nr:hypothetical protein [Myxococcales bacterium]